MDLQEKISTPHPCLPSFLGLYKTQKEGANPNLRVAREANEESQLQRRKYTIS